jgi:hypothetical protein
VDVDRRRPPVEATLDQPVPNGRPRPVAALPFGLLALLLGDPALSARQVTLLRPFQEAELRM